MWSTPDAVLPEKDKKKCHGRRREVRECCGRREGSPNSLERVFEVVRNGGWHGVGIWHGVDGTCSHCPTATLFQKHWSSRWDSAARERKRRAGQQSALEKQSPV